MYDIPDPQGMYEEYRQMIAETYGHTLEKASDCYSVQSYKRYLERAYDVKINEKVGCEDGKG